MVKSSDLQYDGGQFIVACRLSKTATKYARERNWRTDEWHWKFAPFDDVVVFIREDQPVRQLRQGF